MVWFICSNLDICLRLRWITPQKSPPQLGFFTLPQKPGSGADVHIFPCKSCCRPPARRTEPWRAGSPLLLTLAHPTPLQDLSMETKGKRQVWIYPPGGQGGVMPPLMLPMSQDAGLRGTRCIQPWELWRAAEKCVTKSPRLPSCTDLSLSSPSSVEEIFPSSLNVFLDTSSMWWE